MSDLISRQAAIDAVEKAVFKGVAKSAIESLPPVEPELPEFIRCKNCRHDNNCEIQYAAQAGSGFFCGLAESEVEK